MKRIICIFLMIVFTLTGLNAIDFYDDYAHQHKYLGFNYELKNKKYIGSNDKIRYVILKSPLSYTKRRSGEKIFFMNSQSKETWLIDVATSYRAHLTNKIVSDMCKRNNLKLSTLLDIRNMDKNLIDFSIKTLGIDKKEVVFFIEEKGKAYSFYDDKVISTNHMFGRQPGQGYPKKNRYLYACIDKTKKRYAANIKAYKELLDKHYSIEENRAKNIRMRKKVKVGDYSMQGQILGMKGNKVLIKKDECVATYDWGGCAEWKKIPRWISKERLTFILFKEK